MCRAKGEGGRRCKCSWSTKGKAKHNQRRRENRAIRANAAAWALHGGDAQLAIGLANMKPGAVKEWLKANGKNVDDFKEGVPTTDVPDEGNMPAPVGAGAPSPSPASSPAVPAARGAGGAGGGAGASAVQPVAPSPGVAPRAQGWATEWWCSPDLQGRVDAVIAAQGGHRDERSLLAGKPESVNVARGGTNMTSRVELDNGMVGYHKPFEDLNHSLASSFGQSGAEQPVHEVAAWQLASRLGPPYDQMVPPVVVREINGKLGSFALERPGKPMRRDVTTTPEWREAAFFDALIGQQDRHPNNYLVAGDRVALIDHGYTFARPGDYKNYSWFVDKRRRESPALTYQERELLQKLKASPDLLGMRSVLSADRAEALKDRAERMLTRNQLSARF